MQNHKIILYSIAFSSIWAYACKNSYPQSSHVSALASDSTVYVDRRLDNCWYQGKAELTSYSLKQSRYGEYRNGEAVMIFVTEDFSKSKQVKLDNPQEATKDLQKVLKLNFSKKFNTGIYPYSLFQSNFLAIGPHANQHSLKISTSVQEWCGHVYMQLNQSNNTYNCQLNSYFESESDQKFSLPISWNEDEIWSLIKIDIDELPVGKMEMIPALFYLRLMHKTLKSYEVESTLVQISDTISEYQLNYPTLNRKLSIQFSRKGNHEIIAWTESYKDGNQIMQTEAHKNKTIWLDYWNHHDNLDLSYRDSLGLSF